MSLINEELKNLIADKNSLKIVSNQNREGLINSAPKGSLEVSGEDEITYVEILESSSSYRNTVYSIWFDKEVTVLVVGEQKETYLLHTKVKKILTCGTEFEEYYRKYKDLRGFDIAGVVKLTVENVKDLNLAKLIELQKEEHPFFSHYDSRAIETNE